MSNPVVLVPKPKASDEVRDNVIHLLRKTLAEAENGEITSAIMIFKNAAGEWINRCSETEQFSESIGRLEITKQEWIAKYLSQ